MAVNCNSTWLLIIVLCCSCLLSAEGLNFSVGAGSFSNDNMILWGGSNITSSGSISLIPEKNPQQAAGLVYYHQPVRMLDVASKKRVSFSTWFKSFQIPERYNNTFTDRRGDGMTLCFSSDKDYDSGGVGMRLGFFPTGSTDPNLKLVAIEYDTFQNPGYKDPVDDHVGIDVMSPDSVSENTTSFSLWKGQRVEFYSWIDYDGTTMLLEVRLSKNNVKPATPTLRHEIDLFEIMAEKMWVGFSAGTGDAYSFYYIEEWSFTSLGLPREKSSSSGTNLGLIIGCVAGGAVLVLSLAGGLFICIKKRRESHWSKPDESLSRMVGMPDYYSYKQLSVATKAFSETSKLGEGGFGSVYKGVLPSSGVAVAVKRVSADSKQGEREFMAEVSIISQLRHRNVVQLVGWCRDRGKFLLVYELMPHGSLDKALFQPQSVGKVLSWEQRMKILSGLASALHYLHEEWRQQVIHRDVKSSNIMLDDEFNSKLGDFGLARLVDHSKNATTTMVAGTYGYIAPEAHGTGKFTDKTDVFAFGAVTLEIATGRKAFDGSAPEQDIVLVDMVWESLHQGKLITVVDRRLESNYDVRDLEVVLLLGLICSHPDPKSRPSMRQVVQVLAGDAPVPPVPVAKPSASFLCDNAITLQDLQDRRSSSDSLSGPSLTNTSNHSSSFFSSTKL